MRDAPIAFFLPTFSIGGAQRRTATLAGALAARGYRVDLCTTGTAGVDNWDIDPAVRIVDFRSRRVSRSLGPLAKYLAENRPAILFCMQFHAGLTGVVANALSGSGTPVVVVEANVTLSRLRAKSAWDYHFYRVLIRLLYPKAARVLANSDDVRDDLVRHAGLDKALIDVISNPAALPVLRDLEPSASQAWDGWPDGVGAVVATVGRLVAQKDMTTLLRAFAVLRAQRPLRLAIIGDGPDRPGLTELAQQLGIARDTHFLGNRSRPWRYLKRADVFVMSSRFEGFGNTLVEAMAVGCPVVSTDCPGSSAYVLDGGRYGALVPIGDHLAMAAAIARTLDDPPAAGLLKRRAGDFGEPIIDAYLALIARIAKRA